MSSRLVSISKFYHYLSAYSSQLFYYLLSNIGLLQAARMDSFPTRSIAVALIANNLGAYYAIITAIEMTHIYLPNKQRIYEYTIYETNQMSFCIEGDAEVESVSSEQSSHDAERSREASSVGESDSASPGPDHAPVKTQLPAGKVSSIKSTHYYYWTLLGYDFYILRPYSLRVCPYIRLYLFLMHMSADKCVWEWQIDLRCSIIVGIIP